MVGGLGAIVYFYGTQKISEEKKRILVALGAEYMYVFQCRARRPRSYSQAQFFADSIPNSYYVTQYYNMDNVDAHYYLTGPEIGNKTNGELTPFFWPVQEVEVHSAVPQNILKRRNPNIKTIGIDAYVRY